VPVLNSNEKLVAACPVPEELDFADFADFFPLFLLTDKD
jgi:hypothetical protein